MSCVKIVYQLLITARLLAFMAGLALAILSVFAADDDDTVDTSYGFIAFGMGGVHFLFMLVFACSHIKSLGNFLEDSTSCLSLWIYLPEMSVIALLAYFCTLTTRDAQKLAMGATSAFGVAFLSLLFILCGQRILKKDIPEEMESLMQKQKDVRNSKARKQKTKKTSRKRFPQLENYEQENEDHYEQLGPRASSVKPNGVRHPSKGNTGNKPTPQSPKLQDLVRSNNSKMGVTDRGRHEKPRIHGLSDMEVPPTNHNIRNSANRNGDIFSSQGPPLRYTGSYPGSSPFQHNGRTPPLGFSGHSFGPYDYRTGQAPPHGLTNMAAERSRSRYGLPSRFADIPPDY